MKYIIYGKQGCVNCNKAKQFLDNKGIDYEYTDLGTNPEALEFILQEGYRQVPQIYADGEHIGGYEGLVGHVLQNNV